MSDLVDRVAAAIADEQRRWITRDCQVCRFDDSEMAGSFSETHDFPTYRAAAEAREQMCARATAMAAIVAMRKR